MTILSKGREVINKYLWKSAGMRKKYPQVSLHAGCKNLDTCVWLVYNFYS